MLSDEAKASRHPGCLQIIESNCDPDRIDFPIPGNDDASRAISLYCDLISRAALDGIARQQSSSRPRPRRLFRSCRLSRLSKKPLKPDKAGRRKVLLPPLL